MWDDIDIFITFKQNINQEYQGLFIHSVASQIADILYSELGLKLNMKTRLYRLSEEDEKEEYIKNIRKSSLGDEYFSVIQKDNQKEEKPQNKLNKIFRELEKIKNSRVEDYFMRDNSVQKEILQEVFDKTVEKILDKPENKNKIKQIFENFNFDLVKVQPLEILIILLKDETITNKFRKFCLDKTIITTGDANLIIKFLCQTNFSDKKLLDKLKKNVHISNIVDIFLSEKLNCDKPGYYNLTCMQVKKLSAMPNVLEQTRLRILNEKSEFYSVALNHLVNEIHAVCAVCNKQDQVNKNNKNMLFMV